MSKVILKYATLILFIAPFLFVYSCKDDQPEPEPAPTTGKVLVTVSDGSSATLLSDVRLVLYDANNNEPTDNIGVTDANGTFTFTVAGGDYYLKSSKQGYLDIPARGMSGLAFTITNGQTLSHNVEMFANNEPNIGWISGQLSGDAVAGCLVVASDGTQGYSTISDSSGMYFIYNVPAANYNVKAWKAGVNSTETSAAVTANTETSGINLTLTAANGVSVTGAITFLATGNIDVDVALTHPETEESIPGLTTITSGSNYSLSDVPDGTFLARASYANDGVVMDPDWIVKNGEPFVTVAGASTTRDFSVTGAVSVVSPSNDASSTIPVSSPAVPTFKWDKYSSTSDYVIEVSDANGNVIWGGFNADWTVKNIVIPSSQNSIEFNSDGNASSNMESGKVYRWRVYASKDNSQSPTGWELISVSEDQRGLIIIE